MSALFLLSQYRKYNMLYEHTIDYNRTYDVIRKLKSPSAFGIHKQISLKIFQFSIQYISLNFKLIFYLYALLIADGKSALVGTLYLRRVELSCVLLNLFWVLP